MTDKDTTEDLQGQYLDAVRKSQAAVLDGLRSWSDTVQQLVPQRAALAQSEQLPAPSELVDSVFDFAAQLLDAQRQFAHGVLQTTASIAGQVGEEAKTTADRAGKTTKTG